MSLKKKGYLSGRLCRVDSCRNGVLEAQHRTRPALPRSETSERSEVRRPIAFRFESLNSCWVGHLLYDVEKLKVVLSA